MSASTGSLQSDDRRFIADLPLWHVSEYMEAENGAITAIESTSSFRLSVNNRLVTVEI